MDRHTAELLLVDENSTERRVLSAVLRRMLDCKVVSAGLGELAFWLAQGRRFTAAVVVAPRFEEAMRLAGQLRRADGDLPIVLLGGGGISSGRVAPCVWLVTPADPRLLEITLRTLLRGRP